ncbi:VPEID-CTERM sorting domain-containing protein [Celeribacter arenosi]|uniref:VPEID-CTERM protein sorting domain-containing protein n=1 Tax=Celeribacter arenosi TaxID=792649 RepID=A0ABP7K7U0_9RHOB
MKKLVVGTMLALSASPAFAALSGKGTTSVPEISALEGTAALAALAAVVLLAWERRRRSV